jgi:hypothetical protein
MDQELRMKVDQFFDESGALIHIPAKQSKKIEVLKVIAESFDPVKKYSEKELNEIILKFNKDTAAIRRHMIEFGILERNKESIYWLKDINKF